MTMSLLLKGARLVDPRVEYAGAPLDGVYEVLANDGVIVEVGEGLAAEGAKVVDLSGKVLIPGPVDLHVHLREPGQEYKETIASGTRAAAHGGFTGVGAIANTDPVVDEGATVRFVLDKAAATGKVRVYPYGALTKGLEGKQLAEIADMIESGAVAFTDDGRGVQNALLLRRALEYLRVFDGLAISHAEDENLVDGGVVNEGLVSTRLGLAGQPDLAESLAIARDVELARLTGTRLHIAHVSTAASVKVIREAKERGDVRLTAEVTPHHLFLNEDALDEHYNTNLKMNPPLRTEADRQAVLAAFLDGTIDTLATDHAPHAPQEKELEFELAKFGTVGLETALPLVLTNLVADGTLDWPVLVERLSHAPRRILGLEPVTLEKGSVADLTVIDPEAEVEVTKEWLVGKSKNSAFLGASLKGKATEVLVDGEFVLKDGDIVE
jgi:dihydroorotase